MNENEKNPKTIIDEKKYQEQVNNVKKEIESKQIAAFGTPINMGNITMEEYNAFVKRMGNRFINDKTGDIFCPCGKFHPIIKTRGRKRIACPVLGFLSTGATKPRLYEKWMKQIIEFFEEIEKMHNDKNKPEE